MLTKRILVVTYYWPPTGGSGVQRWVKFAKYLPSQGWQPVIYTPSNPERIARDESLLADIPPEVEVVKLPISEPYGIYRKFFGKKKEGAGVNPINSQKKSFLQRLAVWVRGNFFVPDPRVGWVGPSVKFLKEYLEEHPVDVVVTTGPPHSMHLIGLGLKKSLGLRWIADFRDPWTEMFYFKHLGLCPVAERRHRSLEKKVLDSCDAVISVSPLVRDDFQARTHTPVHLVTNGFDEEDFPQGEPPVFREDEFRIVHTGLFASDGNPLNLWDALSSLAATDGRFGKQLRIRLAGKTDPEIISAIKERGLGANLENLGYLPHNEIVSEQRNADILILPLRREPEYRKVLPGKIFEYLAAHRPVLGIGQEDGAAASVLKEAEAGEMLGWNRTSEVMEFIEKEWRGHLSGRTGSAGAGIEKYSRRALTEKLTELL